MQHNQNSYIMDKNEKIREITKYFDEHPGCFMGSELSYPANTYVQAVGRIYLDDSSYRILKKDGTSVDFYWAQDSLIDAIYYHIKFHKQ